jgi:hypothetical protein
MPLYIRPQCSHTPEPNTTALKVRLCTLSPVRLHSGPELVCQLSASTAPLSLGQAEAPLKWSCEDIIRYEEDQEDGYTIYRYTHVAGMHC